MRTLLPLLAAAVLTATLVQPAAAADNPDLEPRAEQRFRRGRRGAGRGRAHRPAHGVPRPARGRRGGGHPRHGRRDRPAHPRPAPARRARPTAIAARVAARLTEGATADVDVRGLRASGNWSEWIPAEDGTAVLPEPVLDVQARLVLTGDPGPEATGLTLTALATVQVEGARAEGNPLSYQIFATREGLVGGTTANGHVITPHDRFVALPSRRALSPNGSSDYSVRICAPNGRCAFAPVWDVGPWNIKDDYWNAKPRAVARPPAGHPAGPGRLPQRLQRRQGRVRPQGRQPGGHRPRRRHLLGRPRPDQQHHGHGGLPVDGQRPAGEGGRHRPGATPPPPGDADVVGTAAQQRRRPRRVRHGAAGCGSASGSSSPPRRSRPPARSGDANPRRARGDLRRDGCCAPDHARSPASPVTCAAAVRATSPCGSTDPSS